MFSPSMEEIGLAYCVTSLFSKVLYLFPSPQERLVDNLMQALKEHCTEDITENVVLPEDVWDVMFADRHEDESF